MNSSYTLRINKLEAQIEFNHRTLQKAIKRLFYFLLLERTYVCTRWERKQP